MKKSLLIISILILSLIYLSYPIYATTTLTIQPDIGDTYVRSNAPDGNFGSAADLRITNYSNGSDTRIHRTYIKFNISSIPADANIIGAILGLESENTINPYQFYSYYVDNQTWSESDITWNTQMCFNFQNSTVSHVINATNAYGDSGAEYASDNDNTTSFDVVSEAIGQIYLNFSVPDANLVNLSLYYMSGHFNTAYYCKLVNGTDAYQFDVTYDESNPFIVDYQLQNECIYNDTVTLFFYIDNNLYVSPTIHLNETWITYFTTDLISINQCNDTPMDSQLWQGASGNWFTIGVKSAIDTERLLSNENVSIMIVNNNTDTATSNFWSKETSESPILNITYSIPSNITVNLISPVNASSSEITTPTFEFQVSSTYTGEPLQAYVYVNGNLVGSNVSVVNGTTTSITSNTSLSIGDYQWYVYVIQDLSIGQSDNMTFSILAVTPPATLAFNTAGLALALAILTIVFFFIVSILTQKVGIEIENYKVAVMALIAILALVVLVALLSLL